MAKGAEDYSNVGEYGVQVFVDVEAPPFALGESRYIGDHAWTAVGSVEVVTDTFTDIASYTVPLGKVVYIQGLTVGPLATGTEFEARLRKDATTILTTMNIAASWVVAGIVMAKATAGEVVALQVAHYEGADRWFAGTIIGWEEDA